ncbi:MAG: hypothetical protein ACTXOO_05180 [Sodalis sp. (in: enterobacteria)]
MTRKPSKQVYDHIENGDTEAHFIALSCSEPLEKRDSKPCNYLLIKLQNYNKSKRSCVKQSCVQSKKRTETVDKDRLDYAAKSQFRVRCGQGAFISSFAPCMYSA